jgi:hypothetical protein
MTDTQATAIEIYTVRFEIEVRASSPKQAATIARDTMLNPDAKINVDVHAMYYHPEADDDFPVERSGWYAHFDGAVQPVIFFAWERMK